MIAGAVVAAAGLSRRMQREKILLPLAGSTILETVLARLAEARIREVVVVLRPDLTEAAERARLAGARVVVNPHPEEQMLRSIRLGVAELPRGLDTFFIWPADHPLVRTETLELLLAQAAEAVAAIPVHKGRRGHPALVGRGLREDLLTALLPGGLRELWRARAEAVREVSVEDPGILANLDTPEAYEEALRAIARSLRAPPGI